LASNQTVGNHPLLIKSLNNALTLEMLPAWHYDSDLLAAFAAVFLGLSAIILQATQESKISPTSIDTLKISTSQ
jgi:hypothetical protein